MNPNHYLAVAIQYLLAHREQWSQAAAVGKTLVSSGMIDRVVARLGRRLCEVPVGFKWFSPGLFDARTSRNARRAPHSYPVRSAANASCRPMLRRRSSGFVARSSTWISSTKTQQTM